MHRAFKNPVDRRYLRRCQLVGVSAAVLLVLSSQVALRYAADAWKPWLAGAAGVCFFTEMVAVGLLVFRKMDEFQRVLLVRSFVWATVITMGLTTVWGFVDLYMEHRGPRLDLVWVPIILITVTALAKVLIFRQHKSLEVAA